MFTENYYNLLRWKYAYLTGRSCLDTTNESLSNLVLYNNSKTQYFISPQVNSDYENAKCYISHTLAHPFRDMYIYVGYASTKEEINDYLAHEKGTGFGSTSGHYIIGDDKKYEEHYATRAYTNNTDSPFILNKFVIQCFIRNLFVTTPGSTTSEASTLRAVMLFDSFDPITMAPGETRRFTFKLRFPLFY